MQQAGKQTLLVFGEFVILVHQPVHRAVKKSTGDTENGEPEDHPEPTAQCFAEYRLHGHGPGFVGVLWDRLVQELLHRFAALFIVFGSNDFCDVGVQVARAEAVNQYDQC